MMITHILWTYSITALACFIGGCIISRGKSADPAITVLGILGLALIWPITALLVLGMAIIGEGKNIKEKSNGRNDN